MPNQTVNKVQFGNQTVMDITDTTADAADVIQGEVFYSKSGVRSTGTLGDATQSAHGLMSSSDKVKLDGIDAEMYKTITTPASVITITDGADDVPIGMEIGIEPIQDLHGYSNPWPAGGGKNLFEIKSYNQSQEITTSVITDSDGNKDAVKCIINSAFSGDIWLGETGIASFAIRILPAGSYAFYAEGLLPQGQTDLYVYDGVNYNRRDSNGKISFTLAEETTINIGLRFISISTPQTVIFKPMLCASTEDSTFAPYSNICHISGWTGAEIAIAAKNWIMPEQTIIGYNISAAGGIVVDANFTIVIAPVKKGMTYYLQGEDDPLVYAFYESIPATSTTSSYNGSRTVVNHGTSFTAEISGYVAIRIADNNNSVMVKLTNDIIDYESGSGVSYEVSFPSEAGTVYGGTLTVNKDGTGTLVKEWNVEDIKSLTFELNNRKNTVGGVYFNCDRVMNECLYNASQLLLAKENEISNIFVIDNPYENVKDCIWAFQNGSNFGVRIGFASGEIDTIEKFNTWLSTQDAVQIYYPLATPVSYTLTAPQVKTLLGLNNIWADTGNINSLTYASSTNNVISTEERYKLSTIEAGAQVNPGNATQSAAGLMSAADKTKLDSITGNVYTDYTITIAVADWTASNGEYVYTWTNSAVTTQCLADVIFVTDPDTVLEGLSLSADKVTGGMQFVCSGTPSGALTVKIRIIDSDTTVIQQNATTTQDGFMTAQDKVKLDAVYQASAYHESDMGIVETTNTATHVISAGQYVIWKGQLYTADGAITVGATLAASGGSKNLTAVSNGGFNTLNDKIKGLVVYSTSEQVIGTWITGDTLYRRVIPNLSVVDNTRYDLTAANIKEMIDLGGFVIDSGNKVFTLNTMDTGGLKATALYEKTDKRISFWMSTGTWNATLILTYTKNS